MEKEISAKDKEAKAAIKILEKNFALAHELLSINENGKVSISIDKGRLTIKDEIALYLIGKAYAKHQGLAESEYAKSSELASELNIPYPSLKSMLIALKANGIISLGNKEGKMLSYAIAMDAIEPVLREAKKAKTILNLARLHDNKVRYWSRSRKWVVNKLLLDSAKDGNYDGVKKALELGANVNIKSGKRATALHYAVSNSDAKIAKLLIDSNARINATDTDGITPLHLAILNENAELATLLIANGANPEIEDKDGKVPIDYANEETKEAIMSRLREIEEEKSVEKARNANNRAAKADPMEEILKKFWRH